MSRDITKAMAEESDRRRTPRFELHAPLTLLVGSRRVSAFTRNVSNRGVFFYVGRDGTPDVGQTLSFLIELPAEVVLSSQCLILCEGRAVRTEMTSWNETGVAAEILSYSVLSGKAPAEA